MKIRWIYILLVGLLAFGLAGCGGLAGQDSSTAPASTPVVPIVTSGGAVVVEGNIVPRDFSRIYTRSGGKVVEVLVKEGDLVSEGDLLMRMDGKTQAEAALSAAKLEQSNAQKALDDLNEKAALLAAQAQKRLAEASRALIEAQQALDDFDTDQFQTDLDKAKTDVNDAKDDLDDAKEEWDKVKDLDADNTSRKNAKKKLEDNQKKYNDAVRERDRLENDLTQYKANVEGAQQEVNDAQREVDQRQGGAPDPDELAVAQARIENAKRQVGAAQANLDDLDIKAPFAGTLVELDVVAGEIMLPSQQLAVLADLSQWFVETSDLTEMDVIEVSVGDKAEVTPDALSDTTLAAFVESIDQLSGKKGGDVTYTVRLALEETDPLLRWGMTVEVRFQNEK